MNTPDTKKHMTVDGVTYNIETGKVVPRSSLPAKPSSDSIRSIRKSQPQQVPTSRSIDAPPPKPMGIIELPQKKRLRKKQIKTTVKNTYATDSGFGIYFIKALLPRGFSAASWVFSVLRAITSPQAWFLAALPILILSFQNVAFENINSILQKVHLFSRDGQIFHALPNIVLLISLAITIAFVRVLFNVIAMHLRMTYLSSHRARLWPAIRLTLHSSLKIVVHNTIQFIFVILTCGVALWLIYISILLLQTTTLQSFIPYIIGLICGLAIATISILHAKHWVQTAILSSSIQTKAIQRRSFSVVMAFPVKSFILGLFSFVLTFGVWSYGVWAALKTIEWLNRATLPSNARFTLLISSIFALAVIVSYLQQSIWTAFSSWSNQQYTPRLFILASESECKNSTTWQIWVSVYLVTMVIAAVSLLVVFILPFVNTSVVNFSSHLPNKIEVPHISR